MYGVTSMIMLINYAVLHEVLLDYWIMIISSTFKDKKSLYQD